MGELRYWHMVVNLLLLIGIGNCSFISMAWFTLSFPPHCVTITVESGQLIYYKIESSNSDYFNGKIKMYASPLPDNSNQVQQVNFTSWTMNSQVFSFNTSLAGKYSFRVSIETASENCIDYTLKIWSNRRQLISENSSTFHKLDLLGIARCESQLDKPFKVKFSFEPELLSTMRYSYTTLYQGKFIQQQGAVGPNVQGSIQINHPNTTLNMVFRSQENYTTITEYGCKLRFIPQQQSISVLLYIFVTLGSIIFVILVVASICLCRKWMASRQSNAIDLQHDGNNFQQKTAKSEGGQQKLTAQLNKECTICLEGELDTILPCRHSFHQKCIREWLNANNACPICRANYNRSNIYRAKVQRSQTELKQKL